MGRPLIAKYLPAVYNSEIESERVAAITRTTHPEHLRSKTCQCRCEATRAKNSILVPKKKSSNSFEKSDRCRCHTLSQDQDLNIEILGRRKMRILRDNSPSLLISH